MPRPHKVRWHATGRWCFSATVGGNRRTFYASRELPQTESGRRKATQWMTAKLAEAHDQVVPDSEWTIEALRLLYLAWLELSVKRGHHRKRTLEGHQKQLRAVCKALGDRMAVSIAAVDVDAMTGHWRAHSIGPTTIRNRLASLQAMLNWAAEPRADRPIERVIPANPIAGMEPPRKVYSGARYAPADELARFLDWVEARAEAAEGRLGRFERLTAALIRFVAETGCRPSEACVLQWRHVKLDRRVVELEPHLHKTGRTGRSRIIALTKRVAETLARLRDDPKRHPDFVFTHRWAKLARGHSEADRDCGTPWNSDALATRFAQLKQEAIGAGVLGEWARGPRKFTLYILRHTLATNLLQRGVNPTDAAMLLGNSPRVVWDSYTHIQEDHVRAVRDGVD